MTTRPAGCAPRSASSGRINSSEPFIARAASSNSGTKYSSHSNRRPTSSIAGIIALLTSSSGSELSASASFVTATAVLESPFRIASYSLLVSAMKLYLSSVELVNRINHSNNVLDRRAGLNVVDRVEYDAAAPERQLVPER